MNLSDCSADHSLGQALGSLLGLPHGLTIGLVLAETLDVSRGDCADRLERVADALGEPDDGTRDGSRAVRGIRRILREVSFPTGRDAGLRPEHVDDLTRMAVEEQSFFLEVDPHTLDRGGRPARLHADPGDRRPLTGRWRGTGA